MLRRSLSREVLSRRALRVATIVSDGWHRVRNRHRPRVLIYTDSRGFDMLARVGKTSFGTHVALLRAQYHVTQRVCPERFTTIVDFLNFMDQHDAAQYDAVVVHCGIVDFSPRPVDSIAVVRATKRGLPRFDDLFSANGGYHARPFDEPYEGQRTTTLYSPGFLAADIIPQLQRIPNLIWVTSNPFVVGWEGNYTRGRPAKIGRRVAEFESIMTASLPGIADVSNWSDADVRRFTIDNVHLSKAGFAEMYRVIDAQIRETLTTDWTSN